MLFILLLIAAAGFAADASPAVTFNRDVLPILQKNCQTCHRPGEIGPMALLTYTDARPWAKAIKAAVISKKMPPWFADPKYGHFKNDRRLSDSDLRTIVEWVDGGTLEGDAKDRPAPIQWADGWNIQPDAVLRMPDPYTVPANSVLQYVYFVFPTGFTRDTYVTAAEVRPGNRSAVHHAVALVRPPGSQWLKEAKPFVPYIPPAGAGEKPDEPRFAPQTLVSYSAGMQAQRFDLDDSAFLIPAGSDIVLQLHYIANGKTPALDQTKIGLTLAPSPPRKVLFSFAALSWDWAIPPGNPNFEGHAELTLGSPVELVFVQSHMHLRGKDMAIRLEYPDGKSQTVLSVPHYDFNWQIIYYLDQPLQLPKGTRVRVTAHWDNSANNPNNPDPAATVRWGDQSWDEMLSAPLGVIVDRGGGKTLAAER